MAATVNNDVIIYNELMQTSYLERIQDVIEVFNANANGTMLITSTRFEGDFSKSAFYNIGESIRHRDVNSTAAAAISGISMQERVDVKTPWVYGTVASTVEAFKRRARSLEEFYMLVGQDIADASMQYYFKLASASLTAAIANAPTLNVSGSIAPDSKLLIANAIERFGDRYSRIRLMVMNSVTYFKIVRDAIENRIDTEIGIVIRGGVPQTLGIDVLVTDQMPSDKILMLQQGAIEIKESQDPVFRTWDYNDAENFQMRFKAEGTVNLSLLGYSYDVAAGANPNIATLSASANWNKHYQDVKSTAGIVITIV